MGFIGVFCSSVKGNQAIVSNDALVIIAKENDYKSTVTTVLEETLKKKSMLPTQSLLYNRLNFFLFIYTYIFLVTVIITIWFSF